MPNWNELLDLIKDQYLSYGYLIVLVAAYLEYLVIVGYLWPGGTVILLGILYSVNGELSLPLIIGLVWLGAILGNMTNYWLGQAGLLRLLKGNRFYPKIEPYLNKAQDFMSRYGRRSIFFSQFVGYIRPFVVVLAGAVKMPFRLFMVFQVPALLIWNILFCGAGFLLVKSFSNVETIMSGIGLAMVVLVGLLWLLYRFFLRPRFLKKLTIKADPVDKENT